MVDHRDLATVKQVAAEAQFITVDTLRWWIFNSERNGLQPALLKIGKRVYIDRPLFNKWLESHRMASKPLSPAA